jgi:hypothetical protein
MPHPAFNGTAPDQPPACERCPAGQVSGPNAPMPAFNGTGPASRALLGVLRGGGRGGHHGRMCVACPDATAANADQTACV